MQKRNKLNSTNNKSCFGQLNSGIAFKPKILCKSLQTTWLFINTYKNQNHLIMQLKS